jgi:hypothetical protein
MPAQIEGENSPSALSVIDVMREATKWHYVSSAYEILTGGRQQKYTHEAAIALFAIKAWLSSSRSLSFAMNRAPAVFCCLLLSEKINEMRKQEKLLYKPFLDVFNNAIDEHNLTPTLNKVFGRINIIEFLISSTWRPHRAFTNEKIKLEIERLNKLTEYRLRLGDNGINYSANDAASLLGAMRRETSWGPTTMKEVRSRWKEKEAFLFIGQREEFSGIVSFKDVRVPDLLQLIEAEAINHERNTNYFANVKGIISNLTPEISKELEKDERWRKIETPSPITLKPFSDDELQKIDNLRLKRVRQSAEEIKAAKRPRSK